MSTEYPIRDTLLLKLIFDRPGYRVKSHCELFVNNATSRRRHIRSTAKSPNPNIPPDCAIMRLISHAMKDASSCSVGNGRSIGRSPRGWDVCRVFTIRDLSCKVLVKTFRQPAKLTLRDDGDACSKDRSCWTVILLKHDLCDVREVCESRQIYWMCGYVR